MNINDQPDLHSQGKKTKGRKGEDREDRGKTRWERQKKEMEDLQLNSLFFSLIRLHCKS